MFEVFLLFVLFLVGTPYFYNKRENPPKIFNTYSQPGKWFYAKYVLVLILLCLKELERRLKPAATPAELESMKCLAQHEKAYDAISFQAASKNGFYFYGGIERLHRAKANGLFYIGVPELGLLESAKLPNTLLDADPASVLLLKEYSAEGISFSAIKPMELWHVSFNGKMKFQMDPTKFVDVKLNGDWTSNSHYFLYEKNMSHRSLATAVAQDGWRYENFERLCLSHQNRYEQTGQFIGTLTVNNKTYDLKMDSFRDHNFGYRKSCAQIHRYVFHRLFLENGIKISLGVVSCTCTSHLLIGHVVLQDKSIHCIVKCDLQLYQHGESGTPGKSYAFSFKTSNDTFDARIRVKYEAFHFKGNHRNNNEAKLIEQFVECEVNSIKGKGVSEWHYNNMQNIK